MSDPNITTQRQIQALQDTQERLRKADVAALYLPWVQRVLNAFPLASSGAAWGEMGQPWAMNLIAWYCSVSVSTTNNGTNFWTLKLIDTASTTLATFNTSAIAANTFTRFVVTSFVQPGASNVDIALVATATLAPGAIFIVPALAVLRTGN